LAVFIILAIVFPVVLLGGVLAMERIERTFSDQTVGERVAMALRTDAADDVERLVSRDCRTALDRHWRQTARRARMASAYPFGRG
jgi:hypothetical protein